MDFDVAVIGAGVVGGAIAHTLSRYKIRVALLEADEDIAAGSSKANSAIVHAGYDCEPGTLMARLNVEGNRMMEPLCEDLHVPFNRIGSLVLAFRQDELQQLNALMEKGRNNGVPDLAIWNADRIRENEPSVSADAVAALYAPTAGIVCPYELTMALAENAMLNGVTLYTNWKVTGIQSSPEGFILTNAYGETLTARYTVNAAGLYADDIQAMAGGDPFTITARRGEYLLADRRVGGSVNHVLFQLPSPMGKGILISPTVDGNLLMGPTAHDLADKGDTATTCEGMEEILRSVRHSLREAPVRAVITAFSGLRAVVKEHHDFIIGHSGVHGLVQAAGICSPGLTAAPAIAQYVAKLLQEEALQLIEKENFDPIRYKETPFRRMSDEERRNAIAGNPLYGRMICRCEMVTEAEVVHAVTGPIPATTVDGVKRRTRAGMGRCQGGFCLPRVMEILCREQGKSLTDVTKSGGGSWMVCKHGDEEVQP